MSDAWHRALRSDELPAWPGADPTAPAPPAFREVELDGAAVLLARLASGEVVALAAHCPHQGTPLRGAGLVADAHLRCEQHRFVYDLRTGRNLWPARDATPEACHRLKPGHLDVYETAERDGWVWVAAQPTPPPADDEAPPEPAPGLAARAPRAAPAPSGESSGAATPQVATVQATAGDEFDLELVTTPRPTHLWQVSVDGDAVAVVGQRFDEHADGLCYRLHVVARAAGSAEVRCAYARPWGNPAETRTFTVHVAAP